MDTHYASRFVTSSFRRYLRDRPRRLGHRFLPQNASHSRTLRNVTSVFARVFRTPAPTVWQTVKTKIVPWALASASKNNHVGEIRAHLLQGWKGMNDAFVFGWQRVTMLVMASYYGCLQAVGAHIEVVARLSQVDGTGDAPLHSRLKKVT